MMTLREVCNELGVSRRAVQGYEKAGLVSPSGKNKYGHLLYDRMAAERIRCVKQYQEFGFSLKEIQLLMVASDEVYVHMLSEKLEQMKQQQSRLKEHIKRMEYLIAARKM